MLRLLKQRTTNCLLSSRPPLPPQQAFLLACAHNHIPIRSGNKRLALPWKCSPAAQPEVALCGACFTPVFTPYVHLQAGRISGFYLHTPQIRFDSLKITSGCLPLKDAYNTRRWQTNACCLFFFIYKKKGLCQQVSNTVRGAQQCFSDLIWRNDITFLYCGLPRNQLRLMLYRHTLNFFLHFF